MVRNLLIWQRQEGGMSGKWIKASGHKQALHFNQDDHLMHPNPGGSGLSKGGLVGRFKLNML